MEYLTLTDKELKEKLRKFVYSTIGCYQDVHKDKGAELTEYIYQDCLEIALMQEDIPFEREFHFHPSFRGIELKSSLRVDFLIKGKIFLECKAIEKIGFRERTQLTNYMRNAGIRIGILYNFAPYFAQCEKFYLDTETDTIYYF